MSDLAEVESGVCDESIAAAEHIWVEEHLVWRVIYRCQYFRLSRTECTAEFLPFIVVHSYSLPGFSPIHVLGRISSHEDHGEIEVIDHVIDLAGDAVATR